ncbi:hypothetical protein [Bordetella genomosp. 9]|uniref:hypothetical protein n=1 Tax=Bordetella genomosp. 9 TaxID=1416803 RepID=UPI0012FC5460|nr:hypothetical protein [Bordetella genomosp. 9]
MQIGRDLADRLPGALNQVADALHAQVSPGTESTLLERLVQWIASNTRKHVKRWWGDGG